MNWFEVALSHLPEAAASPLALIAYLLTVGGLVFLVWRIQVSKSNQKMLEALPEENRAKTARDIIGKPLPPTLSAQAWLKNQQLKYALGALALVCFTCAFVFSIAVSSMDNSNQDSNSPPIATSPSIATTAYSVENSSPQIHKENLVEQLQLKMDKLKVQSILGTPAWSDKEQPWREAVEVYVVGSLIVTVGYDEASHVNIFTVIAKSNDLPTSSKFSRPFRNTFSTLSPPDYMYFNLTEYEPVFLAHGWSTKFWYFAEGVHGTTESEGNTTEGFFITDNGYDFADASASSVGLPSSMANLEIGADIPIDAESIKYQATTHPNGYILASTFIDWPSFFFGDSEWSNLPLK